MSTNPRFLRFATPKRTKRHFSNRDAQAAGELVNRLTERGYSFKEVKARVEAKYGIGAVRYQPHDKPEGAAAARRRRQMEAGQVKGDAVRCVCGNELPAGRQAGMLCDSCLAAKWG